MKFDGFEGKNDPIREPGSEIRSETLLADQAFPIGYFTISPEEDLVRMNRSMAVHLEGNPPQNESLTEKDFWHRIENLSGDPSQTRKQIDLGLKNINQKPVLDLVFKDGHSRLSILLYPAKRGEDTDAGYAGVAFDLSILQDSIKTHAGMLKDLTLQARKSSASIGGKMAALLKNLEVWPRAIQENFLQEMHNQLENMNQALDLTLNLSSSMDSLNVFAERVDLALLVERMVTDIADPDILFTSQIGETDSPTMVQVDPALTRLGLGYLIEEIQGISLPGKLEISLSRDDGSILLGLYSPRTLALPGMSPSSEDLTTKEGKVRIYLAQSIITAQGGVVNLERNSEAGDGYRILIRFQENRSQMMTSLERQKVEPVAIDDGRILLGLAHADQQIRYRDIFQDSGYRVDLAVDGSTILDIAQRNNPDLVIVSRNLPGLDGLLVTQGIRRWSAMPIIMISERTNPDDLNYAYQLGVDDYLRVPVAREELLARARVCIRRSAAAKQALRPDIFQSNQLKIDYSMQKVWIRGAIIELTPIEYNLLVYMSRHGNQIIHYEQLLENVWEGPEKGSRQGLFVHVKRLREKIEIDPKDPQIITNKWGVGYVFTA